MSKMILTLGSHRINTMTDFIPALDAMLRGEFERIDDEGGIISYENAGMTLSINPNSHIERKGTGKNDTYHGSHLRLTFNNLPGENEYLEFNGSGIPRIVSNLNQMLTGYGTEVSELAPLYKDKKVYVIPRFLLSYQNGTSAADIVNSITAVMENLRSRLDSR